MIKWMPNGWGVSRRRYGEGKYPNGWTIATWYAPDRDTTHVKFMILRYGGGWWIHPYRDMGGGLDLSKRAGPYKTMAVAQVAYMVGAINLKDYEWPPESLART